MMISNAIRNFLRSDNFGYKFFSDRFTSCTYEFVEITSCNLGNANHQDKPLMTIVISSYYFLSMIWILEPSGYEFPTKNRITSYIYELQLVNLRVARKTYDLGFLDTEKHGTSWFNHGRWVLMWDTSDIDMGDLVQSSGVLFFDSLHFWPPALRWSPKTVVLEISERYSKSLGSKYHTNDFWWETQDTDVASVQNRYS